MTFPRLLVSSAFVLLGATCHAMVPLSDSELSQVNAAGLPDAALQGIALNATPAADVAAAHDPSGAALDRQQSLSETRFAAASAQGSLGLMRSATLPALFTPFAPLVLPALAMPFPFFMAPPPKKH